MKLSIPTKLEDVTIGTFIKIAKLEASNDPEAILDRNIKILSLLTGEPEDTFLELTASQLSELVGKIAFLNELPEAKAINQIKINGNLYQANLLINELTAGQYIDLSEFIKNPINNLHKIMATLYLPAKKTWYGKLVVEKYNGRTQKERSDEFYRYMPISVAYPAALFFLSSIERFNNQYRNLLYKQGGGGDESGSKIIAGAVGQFNERWGWHNALDSLSNNCPEKWTFFTKLNVVEFLNMLAYYKDKERIKNLMMKNAKLRNG